MLRHALAALGVIAALLAFQPSVTSGTELLLNGGFESGTGAWGHTDGVLDTAGAPVYSGATAGRLQGVSLQIHEVYQSFDVQGGAAYRFSGWLYLGDEAVARAFLKARWFDSSGNEIYNEQSPPLTIRKPEYQAISTGVMTAPALAVRARFGILVEPNAPFIAYLDNFSLDGPVYTPGPTAAPTPAPTPQPTGTPSPPPPPGTPPGATQSPTPAPTAAPAEPPEFFSALTNGGFEDLDGDGMPYGWRKAGGQVSVASEPRLEGSRALRFASASTSTKWVYQTVLAEPGAHYQASAYGLRNSQAVEALFLRLSWYATENGSGTAIGSADSLDLLSTDAPTFRSLTTGPVEAPPGARSVKVRLMLRPVSDAPVAAYFDDVRLTRVPPPAVTAPVPGRDAATASVRKNAVDASTPAVLGVVSTPVIPANVRARPTPVALAAAGQGGNGSWLTFVSLAVAAVSLGVAGFELWRRRTDQADD